MFCFVSVLFFILDTVQFYHGLSKFHFILALGAWKSKLKEV